MYASWTWSIDLDPFQKWKTTFRSHHVLIAVFSLLWTRVELGGERRPTRNASLEISEMGKQTKWDINLKGMELGMSKNVKVISLGAVSNSFFQGPGRKLRLNIQYGAVVFPGAQQFSFPKDEKWPKEVDGAPWTHTIDGCKFEFCWQMVWGPILPFLQVLEK